SYSLHSLLYVQCNLCLLLLPLIRQFEAKHLCNPIHDDGNCFGGILGSVLGVNSYGCCLGSCPWFPVLVFKYRNDSVLGVNRNSYESCIVSDPIFEFEDVDTVFWFNRHGFFYFISGNPDHCQAGQRLVVLVMGQSGLDVSHGPTAAPSPVEGGDTGGSSGYSIWASPPNATTKLSAASYFLSALGRVSLLFICSCNFCFQQNLFSRLISVG
ncbi:early nodulin-like protein 2, partial [Punica granatum]|uniref:Early nodulin-like protein 2 n=1 Tax=Punica granatum TaxID=22663 RepID=A0A6P8ECT9_PUNGR